ncbi:sulfate adenylyltransferase subunit CysN [Gammaproteobacteria bacterium]|nr:sulfate adenylyltransferase subunit CysN [Gammaproteobacteria bacterium]
MSSSDPYIRVTDYLESQQSKELLRFITCGSVDDGKSTLIGRLLFDSKLIYEDQLAALEKDSKSVGTQQGNLDLALLVDGLTAEREQGITIDVAYRFFSTKKRKFIVADTPGHEQYTRNMATGASTADVAVILVDAGLGIQTQTYRHSHIASLLGIRNVILAVNKMDLVDYQEATFTQIKRDYEQFSRELDFDELAYIPISALHGDNVIVRSERMPWYRGDSLLEILEEIDIADESSALPFRLPVQWVNRPSSDFRGFAGTVCSGSIRVGEPVEIQPRGFESRIKRLIRGFDDVEHVGVHQAVTVVLEDEIDCSRGDLIVAKGARCQTSDQLQATVIWMSDKPLLSSRQYLFKTTNNLVQGEITDIRHKVNVNTLENEVARQLQLNEVGVCNVHFDRPIVFAPYEGSRTLGSFIVIDRLTNDTVAVGMCEFGLRRADNIQWQALDIDKTVRADQKSQRPAVLWFTGLSGAGKSTIANLVEKKLNTIGKHTYLLDGDNVRHGLTKDLGFTDADRVENIRRVGEVSHLMIDAGLLVLSSFISPFRSDRDHARARLEEGEFIEIFVDASLETCEERDSKGLYAKARMGELPNFTGVHSKYEPPLAPELTLDCEHDSAEICAEQVIQYLRDGEYLD